MSENQRICKEPRIILLLASLIICTLTGLAQPIPIQGIQSGVLESDTVLITGDVLIPAGEQLQFLPGTSIIATGFFRLDVRGSISATGTHEQPIVFTVTDTASFADPETGRGGWDGIHYSGEAVDSDSSVFHYCTFNYGKALGDSLEKMGGVFNIRHFGKIRISFCTFSSNYAFHWGGAVFAEDGDIKVCNSSFSDNISGQAGPPYGYGGAICFRYAQPVIVYCSFTNNTSTGIGGALSLEYSDALLSKNVFSGNTSGLGGALGYIRSAPEEMIEGNLFINNSSRFFGGAIAFIKSSPMVMHNTITGNSSDAYGGGLYCNDSAAPLLINSIVYDNYAPEGSQLYIWDLLSAPQFMHCNIQGGKEGFSGTGGLGYASLYLNNIDSVPLFLNEGTHPYALSSNSPCINKGVFDSEWPSYPVSDLMGKPRISGNFPDIGAYEFQDNLGIPAHSGTCVVTAWPNPFRDQLLVNFSKSGASGTSVKIYDMKGTLILTEKLPAGVTTFSWDGRINNNNHVDAGIYFLQLSSPEFFAVQKIVFH